MMEFLNNLGKFLTEYGTVGCLVLAIAAIVFQEKQRRLEREENRTAYRKQQEDIMRVAMAANSAMRSFAAEIRDLHQASSHVKAKNSISDYISNDANLDIVSSDGGE